MSLKVLVVDDSSVMRSIIIKSLRMSGIPLESVIQAGNGKEALAALEQNPIDLVLVDINMPVMSGDELIVEMRQRPALSVIKVIVVSSDHTDTRMEQLGALGVPIIHKPFNPGQLKDLIVSLTGVSHGDSSQETAF